MDTGKIRVGQTRHRVARLLRTAGGKPHATNEDHEDPLPTPPASNSTRSSDVKRVVEEDVTRSPESTDDEGLKAPGPTSAGGFQATRQLDGSGDVSETKGPGFKFARGIASPQSTGSKRSAEDSDESESGIFPSSQRSPSISPNKKHKAGMGNIHAPAFRKPKAQYGRKGSQASQKQSSQSLKKSAEVSTVSGLVSSGKSYGTSDILKVRERMHALADQPSTRLVDTRGATHNKENISALSPSPTAELLHTAQTALRPNRAQPRRLTVDNAIRESVRTTCRSQVTLARPLQQPKEDTAEGFSQRQYESLAEPRTYRNVSRPVREQPLSLTVPPESGAPASRRPIPSYIWTESIPQYAPTDIEDDEEMLLGNHDPAFDERGLAQLQTDEHLHYDAMQQKPDFPLEPEDQSFDYRDPDAVHEQFQWPHVSSMPAGTSSIRDNRVAPTDHRRLLDADERAAKDTMQEFWRPNRLY